MSKLQINRLSFGIYIENRYPRHPQVEGAHSSDINAIAVSQKLSLVASGSADGTCRIWDFQFLTPEGYFYMNNDIMCLCFLGSYPLVAVGDAGGYISIIPVR